MSADQESSDIHARNGGNGQSLSPMFSGLSARVREVLALDLKQSRLSREQIAIELTETAGRPISLDMIEAYVAGSKPHRFPAELVPAWVSVLGSRRLLEVLCGELGLSPATQEDRDFADLGRTRLRDEQLTRKLQERIR